MNGTYTTQKESEGGMGNKFTILCSKYPYEEYWQHSYNTNSIIKFIFNLVKCYFKYKIIDVNIRNIEGGGEE